MSQHKSKFTWEPDDLLFFESEEELREYEQKRMDRFTWKPGDLKVIKVEKPQSSKGSVES